MLNRVEIIGRLGHPPSTRYTNSGTPVCNFSVATDEKWTDKDGNKQESTEWHNVVAWGKLAEICDQYLDKGKLIWLSGKLKTRKWQDKDGNDRYTTEIIASEMKMLSSKNESSYDNNNSVPVRKPDDVTDDDMGGDSIPF